MWEGADPRFEFVRYGESLAMSQPSFDPLAQALAAPPTLVERHLDVLVDQVLARYSPRVALISAPFRATSMPPSAWPGGSRTGNRSR